MLLLHPCLHPQECPGRGTGQRNRRNLTDAELARCIDELGKRQRGGAAGNPSLEGLKTAPPTAAEIADKLGTSTIKVEKYRVVKDHAPPEVRQAVEAGDMSINAAKVN